jgi:uncharacterized DUF497 family protein
VFGWDIRKAIANYERHGVPFEEAATVFGDPQDERRFKRIGRSIRGRILLVVYTIKSKDDEEETIRIISARQASRKEREAYSRFAD